MAMILVDCLYKIQNYIELQTLKSIILSGSLQSS